MIYIPVRGDVVWLSFDPQLGKEQAGRRPALVLSHQNYNRAGLAICCPITSRVKGYPFEVLIPEGLPVSGAVLSDHVKSFDWHQRDVEYLCKMPQEIVEDVLAKFNAIVRSDGH